MSNHFQLLSKHRSLSLKRKTSDKQRQIGVLVSVCLFVIPFGIVFFPLLMENAELISPFVLPTLIVLDFLLRFFIRKGSSAMIFPYLTLPIPRRTLLYFIIVSDLRKFSIWGIMLIYCGALLFFNAFTFWNIVFLCLFILFNNYLIAFVKVQFGVFSLLLYPICLAFVGGILFLGHLLNPLFAFPLLAIVLYGSVASLYHSLKEKLYVELNRFAL